ncbi:uncharacterized protein LOC144180146 [Haemaphysalis longicornis]
MKLDRGCVHAFNRTVALLARTGSLRAILPGCRGTSTSAAEQFPELQPRPESAYHTAYRQPGTGRIYDKKPFRFEVRKGRVYHWCSCGFSHTQPFCDGSHRNPHLKITLKPIRFVAEETRVLWFCNCKQTANRPYCDGSHKKPQVQEQTSVIK